MVLCDVMLSDAAVRMQQVLERQRLAQIAEGPPCARVRIDRLQRAIAVVAGHRQEIADAACADFGHRSLEATQLIDVAAAIAPLRHARQNLRRWMRRDHRRVTPTLLGLFGARAWVDYQPKGVVGIVAPWNFPVATVFAPLAGVFAAGNRAMIKPSEHTPQTSALIVKMIRLAFDETEAAVFTGRSEVGAAFSRLAFDHLLFTGSGGVAREIQRAAAENLVPTTLELGGKSPVIVGRSADMALTGRRVMMGKLLNAGQACVAPDYMLVPEDRVSEFVAAARAAVGEMFSTLTDNPDYTAIINARHFDRLTGYLRDAAAKGAEIVELGPAREDFCRRSRRMPPTLVLDPTCGMAVMQEEIFGPILPVMPYRRIDDAIAFVNGRARPLALYYFGRDVAEQNRVLSRTVSGGAAVNEVVLHVTMADLPFGGVGASGLGAYGGVEGFRAFSHARAVLRQSRFDVTAPMRPPYGKAMRRLIDWQIGRSDRTEADRRISSRDQTPRRP